MPKFKKENFEGLKKNTKYYISSDLGSSSENSNSDSSTSTYQHSNSDSSNSNKIIKVKKCQPKKILESKIKNMQYLLTKILKSENKGKPIESLIRDNLLTLKLIIKNIESQKS